MQEMPVLDQLEEVEKIDKSGMLKVCMKMPEHCRDAIQRAKRTKIPKKVKVSEKITIQYKRPQHILVLGMGGSAIGGEILRDWLRNRTSIPIEVCRDYVLPAYANKDTLVFAVSYSGNTDETLSAFVEAINRGCMTIAITSGGHLLSFSEKLGIPYVKIPGGMPAPRVAIPYLFFPLPVLMKKMGILFDIQEETEEALKVLEELSQEIGQRTPTKNNLAKKLALELEGTIPVVYGFRQYEALARRLKAEFNENAKIPCRQDVFPELNHNEVMGWEAPEAVTKQFSVVLLRDRKEPPEIKHKIEATKDLALKKAQKILEIYARGEKNLAKILSILHVGDLASVYLAILRKTDPTPVETITKIKKEMTRRFDIIRKLEEKMRKITEGSTI